MHTYTECRNVRTRDDFEETTRTRRWERSFVECYLCNTAGNLFQYLGDSRGIEFSHSYNNWIVVFPRQIVAQSNN
jgi:hypothetical protein